MYALISIEAQRNFSTDINNDQKSFRKNRTCEEIQLKMAKERSMVQIKK